MFEITVTCTCYYCNKFENCDRNEKTTVFEVAV